MNRIKIEKSTDFSILFSRTIKLICYLILAIYEVIDSFVPDNTQHCRLVAFRYLRVHQQRNTDAKDKKIDFFHQAI